MKKLLTLVVSLLLLLTVACNPDKDEAVEEAAPVEESAPVEAAPVEEVVPAESAE